MKQLALYRRAERLAAFALAAMLLGAAAGLAEDVPSKLGPDFQVNTFTLGDQDNPDVARYPDGRFMVVWRDYTNSRVKARLYLASGAPAGGEVGVSEAGSIISPPHVAVLPNGGFAVVWGDSHDVLLRLFDGEAHPLASAVAVNGSHPDANRYPDIATDSRGNLAIVWHRDGFFEDLVLLRRFDAAGNPQGDPVQVNPSITRRPFAAHVALNDSGSLLVSWHEGVGSNMLARRFDGPSGTWAKEMKVEAPFGGQPMGSAPLLYPEGDGAVVFGDIRAVDYGVFAQRLDAAGSLLGEVVLIGEGFAAFDALDEPGAAIDGTGNAFVIWSRFEQDGDLRIFGRLLDRSMQPLGDAFAVSSDPLDLNTADLRPAVAADAFGGFAVVWSDGRNPFFFPIPELPPQILNGRDGSQFGVFGQVLGDPECTADSEVLCLGEGNRFRVEVSWKTPAGDTGVGHARRLTADTGALWFFQASNLELMIKVLDGRPVNGHFWVFYGALSNVQYTITVTDTATGKEKTYTNPAGQLASRADVTAFKEAAPASAPAATNASLVTASDCGPGGADTALCLGSGRFRVDVTFVDPTTRIPAAAHAIDLTADTGAFWFFQPSNLELMIKILDGRPVNGHFWVFYGALSNVQYTIKVTDTETGEERAYVNQRGRLASRADVTAFPVGGH
ncbi:MAG TPA: hypothetical protein VGX68_18420 [Thermoanaerobaculia bacterium]|jgi:hypothetical protein|nr:hypothetical protein [Thermoanaerobaculia bacterium]